METAWTKEERDLSLFFAGRSLPVKKSMLKAFGPNTTIWLTIMIEFSAVCEEAGTDDAEFVHIPPKEMQIQTGLSLFQQAQIVKRLMEMEIIEVKKKGIQNWYLVRIDILASAITDTVGPAWNGGK